MSTGFLKHGFVKGGLFIKHGLLLPIDTLKIIPIYLLHCDVLHAFLVFTGCTIFTLSRI